MNKQTSYNKLFSLYSHPHIRVIPYLYANCSGMLAQDQWEDTYNHFKIGRVDPKNTYKIICSRSGGILKLVQVENVNIGKIAESIVAMIKENNNYIVFSVLINCNVQTDGKSNENIVVVLLRSGIANKHCLAEGSDNMEIQFYIMGSNRPGKIVLNRGYNLVRSDLYETIQGILGANKLTLIGDISIELIMTHKRR